MELPIALDMECGIPIYIQLREQIHLLILRGALKPGDPMPTTRSLAVQLGINANTVVKVYRDLQRENYLRLKRGVGTFVAEASEGQTIGEDDMEALNESTRELIALGRRSGLAMGEVFQLIETLWKEKSDAQR